MPGTDLSVVKSNYELFLILYCYFLYKRNKYPNSVLSPIMEINNLSVVYRYLCDVGKKSQEKNCKRTIRYQRPTPPVPATYADVRLPEEYITTTNKTRPECRKQNVSLLLTRQF